LCDDYCFYPATATSQDQRSAAAEAFLGQLRQRGTFPVGGAGGCLLVSRAAIDAGAGFSRLHNVGIYGDDRHFSIRAVALGFDLWVDTYYPLLHLYREADLALTEHFWAKWQPAGALS
jgi:hypothetical protein